MDLDGCLAATRASSAGAGTTGPETPNEEEIAALLEYARAVAHAGERKAAPIAAYAVGIAWSGVPAPVRVGLLRSATAVLDATAVIDAPAGDGHA